MEYVTSIVALFAFAPLALSAPHPATAATVAPQCKLIFNEHMCKDHNKEKQLEFVVSVADGPSYIPHKEIPQTVHSVSHCYDFIDTKSKDTTKNKHAKPTYDINGRPIAETDRRSLYKLRNGMGHLWMTEDKCAENYKAMAVFERPHYQGAFVWYNLPVMRDTKEASVVHDGGDWCVAPFKLIFHKPIGSFMMLEKAPENKFFGLQVDA